MWFYFSSVWAQWWIFWSILNSIGVRQHISGPTHCRNHTLNWILSHGIDVNGVEVLQQSDDISDHYLVFCKLHIAKAVNSTPCYKYGRTITSTTKDCFVNNLSYSSQFLSTSNSAEKLDDLTETMDSLLSSTLDTISPLCLRKIKENSLIPWYNEHTRTLKRAARKMESVTMQPPGTVLHQILHYRSPEEQFHSFSTIGEEELYKLVKSAKPTTCMLDLIFKPY